MFTMIDKSLTDNFAWVEAMIAEREKLGMTQADLARAARLSRTAISIYERRGRSKPDAKSLSKISVALQRPPDWLPRLAKILPDEPEDDPVLKQIDYLYSTLRSEQSKQQALDYLKFLKIQEEQAEYHVNRQRKTHDNKK